VGARQALRFRVAAMSVADIPAVQRIERESFRSPWPSYAFRQELETNRLARYVVVCDGSEIVGYAGLWLMVDEAHVTTFAVAPERRREGIGEVLLGEVLTLSSEIGATVATLEVRASNMPARKLYEKYGFQPVGVRRRYYTDDNEDALIMTTPELASREMRVRLARLEAELIARSARVSPHPAGEWVPDGQGSPRTAGGTDAGDAARRTGDGQGTAEHEVPHG
jgi:[ribosomal protein S18]-alanine N-acetyltransferase